MNRTKSFFHTFRPALTVTVILMLICGLGFPLLMTGIAQVVFPDQAGGSLLLVDDQPVGSRLVGQEFTEPYFMKCRPSAVHYNTYQEDEAGEKTYADGTAFGGLASGSANYGPSSPDLRRRVQEDMETFLAANPDIAMEDIPTDLMTASGSGLDPHLSPAAAAVQLPAIAEASGLSMETLEGIVADHTTGKLLGLFGTQVVNVLEVNADIAAAMEQNA